MKESMRKLDNGEFRVRDFLLLLQVRCRSVG